jgi:hypothetical protein
MHSSPPSIELSLDPTIRSHLAALYDTLLEQNLLRIIEPYGVVELEHVAQGVGQTRATVEKKLSQMILDKVFYGVLDQGNGWLVVFDEPVVDVRLAWLAGPGLFSFWLTFLAGHVRRGDPNDRAGGSGCAIAIRQGEAAHASITQI